MTYQEIADQIAAAREIKSTACQAAEERFDADVLSIRAKCDLLGHIYAMCVPGYSFMRPACVVCGSVKPYTSSAHQARGG